MCHRSPGQGAHSMIRERVVPYVWLISLNIANFMTLIFVRIRGWNKSKIILFTF